MFLNTTHMKDKRKILSIQKHDIIRKFHENNSELALGQELKHENRCSERWGDHIAVLAVRIATEIKYI